MINIFMFNRPKDYIYNLIKKLILDNKNKKLCLKYILNK